MRLQKITEQRFIFPAEIVNNIDSLVILLDIADTVCDYCIKHNAEEILLVFDFSKTKLLETNLLVLIKDIFSFVEKHKYNMQIHIRSRIGRIVKIRKNFILSLHKKYFPQDKQLNLICNTIDMSTPNPSGKLLEYNLKDYAIPHFNQTISTISELFSNIPMHSNSFHCEFSGYVKDNKMLILSILNNGATIKEHLVAQKKTYQRSSEAIIWALKKSSTTRVDGAGGLGLYFLRKNLANINGKFHILSDESYLYLVDDYYDRENENHITYPDEISYDGYKLLKGLGYFNYYSKTNRNIVVPTKLKGNLFILEIPLEQKKNTDQLIRKNLYLSDLEVE